MNQLFKWMAKNGKKITKVVKSEKDMGSKAQSLKKIGSKALGDAAEEASKGVDFVKKNGKAIAGGGATAGLAGLLAGKAMTDEKPDEAGKKKKKKRPYMED